MCYYTHYIFLWCGHSVTALHPVRPSPPCPNRRQSRSGVKESEAVTSPRPFSFDPSVIASPLSSLPEPEPFSMQTPWRLERPFSTPESASPTATTDEEIYAAVTDDHVRHNPPRSKANAEYEQENMMPEPQSRGQGGQLGRQKIHTADPACGQIHIHPYRTYKIEGLCLHCRRRRDTRLASFEANAIRESVYRESMLGSSNQRGPGRRFEAIGEQAEQRRLKSLPSPIATLSVAVPVMEDGADSEQQGGYQQQDQQQQQTPWRLTMPPAMPPKNGDGLEGMRDGEWI